MVHGESHPNDSPAKSAAGSASQVSGRTLAQLGAGQVATVVSVGGPRVFRRRLLELGLVPGTQVAVVNVAPLGDPLEIALRGSHLSVRREQAEAILVQREGTRRLPVIQ